MNGNKHIYDYVEYELNIFRNQCNFSDEELTFFNYRAKQKTMEEIGELMNISRSKTYAISKSVNTKMNKIKKIYLKNNK